LWIVYDAHVNANISTWFENETLGKFAEVVTDSTGTLCEKGMVFTREEIELKRDGERLNGSQVNNLFAYWHGAGHKVTRLVKGPL
jgi:magnesium-transporting ATPase (P-type)